MGTLTPGATYIYEHDGQKIYAREIGSAERRVIGETMDQVYRQRADDTLWRQIRAESKNNPALQNAIDNVMMIYQLSKNHG